MDFVSSSRILAHSCREITRLDSGSDVELRGNGLLGGCRCEEEDDEGCEGNKGGSGSKKGFSKKDFPGRNVSDRGGLGEREDRGERGEYGGLGECEVEGEKGREE